MTLRFTTRLFLCALLPALLFMTALSASLWGSMRTQVEFDRYIGTEQQVASGLNEMYAQGLQMGQAMRNVVLNPENQKAFENFALAEAAFAKAFEATAATAKGTAMEKEIQRLAPLREAQASKQARVISLVKTDVPGAIKALNAEETPAWRALRALLIEQIAASRELASTVHAQTKQRASNMTWVAVALALAAIGTAVVMTVLLMNTVKRELGGDPVDACNALRRIADGDLSVDADAQGAALGLMGQLGRTQERLRELVTQVRRSTDSIHVASSEIASGNHDLSGRTEQAAANLQQTASSMEELTGAVRQSADAARQANQLAASAAEVAVRGGKVVTQVVGTMDAIHASSRKIADITGVIDGIAFQTNILALNAAVEAARAGEQGRGFAVVAGEVRLLAQRSAEAAREIKALIGSSVDKVEAGSRLVADAGTTMTDIVASVQRVTDIIGEITASAAEQASGIGQVHGSVTELDHMTQQNAALVEQSAAAASSLNEQAQRLSQLVATFKLNPA